MTTVTVLAVTPCQVAPPLSPPAHCAMHGECSSRPVTQNGLPAAEPVAGADTPACPARPLPAETEPPAELDPGVVPLPAPAGRAPPGRVEGPPDCWGSGADDEAAPGVPEPNWPPSVLPCDALLDGATITSTIWAATSRANGA